MGASTRWVIEVDPDGSCDIKLDGKRIGYEYDDEEDALDFIRSHRDGGRGKRITVIEADGYHSSARS